MEYELIYLDKQGNVRYIENKNKLFFEDAYYSYIGNEEYTNFIYVLKDGLMKYESSNSYLSDGNYHLKYLGSFYTLKNNQEQVYIIDTKGYLYKIDNFSESSSVVLKRVSNNLIKRIGTRTITNESSFATDKSKILIEFVNDEILSIEESSAFSLIA